MSISDATKLDAVFKKSINRDRTATVKNWYEENPGGGFLTPDTRLWVQANQILTTPPAATTTLIEVYSGSGALYQLGMDSTVSGNKSWTGSIKNLIPPVFGAGYAAQIYTGSAVTGEVIPSSVAWHFDYERNILTFESTQTYTTLYAKCYRYIGKLGFSTTVVYTTLSFAVSGSLGVGTWVSPALIVPVTMTASSVMLMTKTKPVGANLICDINKSGSANPMCSIFAAANRPTIIANQWTGSSGAPQSNSGSLTRGDIITLDIDQVGSSTAGSDLTVELICAQSLTF